MMKQNRVLALGRDLKDVTECAASDPQAGGTTGALTVKLGHL